MRCESCDKPGAALCFGDLDLCEECDIKKYGKTTGKHSGTYPKDNRERRRATRSTTESSSKPSNQPQNTRPQLKFIEPVQCCKCSKTFADEHDKLLLCELCEETWKCDKCLNLTPEMYLALQESKDLTWICPPCKKFRGTCDKYVTQAVKVAMEDFAKTQELKFEKNMKELEKRVQQLEEGNNVASAELTSIIGTDAKQALTKCEAMSEDLSKLNKKMSEMITEPDEIDRRKANIMIRGMPEKAEIQDTDLIQELGQALGADDIFKNAKRIFRIGQKSDTRSRPRAIKVVCSSENDKDTILRLSKKLKDTPGIGLSFKPSDVYLGPDQTAIQRERAYQARVRRRQLKEKEQAQQPHNAQGQKN